MLRAFLVCLFATHTLSVTYASESRTAIILRDNVPMWQQVISKFFSVTPASAVYDHVEYFNHEGNREAFDKKAQDAATAAAKRGDIIDVFVLAHTNSYYGIFENLPEEVRSHIRLVYDTGCFDGQFSDKWLSLGARAYVGHVGNNSASLYFPDFFTRWATGGRLVDIVRESNSKVVTSISVTEGLFSDVREEVTGTQAAVFGESNLNFKSPLSEMPKGPTFESSCPNPLGSSDQEKIKSWIETSLGSLDQCTGLLSLDRFAREVRITLKKATLSCDEQRDILSAIANKGETSKVRQSFFLRLLQATSAVNSKPIEQPMFEESTPCSRNIADDRPFVIASLCAGTDIQGKNTVALLGHRIASCGFNRGCVETFMSGFGPISMGVSQYNAYDACDRIMAVHRCGKKLEPYLPSDMIFPRLSNEIPPFYEQYLSRYIFNVDPVCRKNVVQMSSKDSHILVMPYYLYRRTHQLPRALDEADAKVKVPVSEVMRAIADGLKENPHCTQITDSWQRDAITSAINKIYETANAVDRFTKTQIYKVKTQQLRMSKTMDFKKLAELQDELERSIFQKDGADCEVNKDLFKDAIPRNIGALLHTISVMNNNCDADAYHSIKSRDEAWKIGASLFLR